MSKFKHYNPKSSPEKIANTESILKDLLRKKEIIGTNFTGKSANLQYGKIRDIELVITVSEGVVVKVEEF